MNRSATSLAVAVAVTAVVGTALSLTVAPTAHADPRDAIRNTVLADRFKYAPQCPPYTYDAGFEEIAGRFAVLENPNEMLSGNFNGMRKGFLGSGDPQAAATTSAYERGAGQFLSECDYTRFGVGLIRHEDREIDVVTIVFGDPYTPPGSSPDEAVLICGPDQPPIPVSQPCPVAPLPPPPEEKAPTDAVRVNIARAGLQVRVTVTSTADIPGQCTYNANDVNGILPPASRDFGLGPKGTTTLNFPAPPPLSTYHVVVSCRGDFKGKNVEFGHVEQDVSG